MYGQLEQRPSSAGVSATGLGKRFGDQWALRDLDLDVAPGTVLGLLGHNGAGKTTAIRILTTLSEPTEGTARVAGFDVATHGLDVRRRIGVAAQQATVDGLLTAPLNLELVGRLHGLSKKQARMRADQLLTQLDLDDARDKLVKTFSGGMRRRLDLAASIVARPDVLFLDEPTTGLDPRSRNDLWSMLVELKVEGTTIILTTQYLDEADRMADDIVVLDHGRAVAHGSPQDLKAQVGDNRVDVTVAEAADLIRASKALTEFTHSQATTTPERLVVTAAVPPSTRLIDVIRYLDDAGVDATDVTRREATLDDVFLTLTAPDPTSAPDRVRHPGETTTPQPEYAR
jgi:ABC-2 type transport system ATP-binding protein